MATELFSLFKSVMRESDTPLVSMMQKSIDFAMEMVAVLSEVFFKETGRKRIPLTDAQRRRLHTKATCLSRKSLMDISTVFQADTILGWFRKEVGMKYDRHGGKRKGPAPVPREVEELVLSLARQNPSWGYDKIVGTVTYLGHSISKASVKRILDANGLVPSPDGRKHTDWAEFIAAHKDIIAATDFLTAEVMGEDGPERYHIQFYIKVGSRRVELGGIRHAPGARWVNQVARNMADCEDGFLRDQKILIHDRDPLFTDTFTSIMNTSGITTKRLPPHRPNMNAYIERFIQSIEVECLDRLIVTSEEELRYVVSEYLMYYNHERPHQGLGNVCIDPLPQDPDGDVIEFSRLGGLLRSYRRLRMDNPDYSRGKPLFLQANAS